MAVVTPLLAPSNIHLTLLPSHARPAPSATTRKLPPPPVLAITIAKAPCTVFVENSATNDILHSDNTPAPKGATLRFRQSPLLAQISDPTCAHVYIHGHRQSRGSSTPWLFSVPARPPPVPALLIRIVHEPCTVFVKNAASNVILQSGNTPAPPGAKLVYEQVPLQVQISDPHCADVFVHGRKQAPATTAPWIFSVQS